MNLDLTSEQELLRDTFEQLLGVESSCDRVRAAEESGFDPALWGHLVDVGALGVRVPEARGGMGASLLDAVLLAEQAGRHLVTGPLLESVVVCSGLSDSSLCVVVDPSGKTIKEIQLMDVLIDNGYAGWAEHAPYNGIIVTAAATHIPRPLVERYVRAAHRNGALLLLDLQTGRASFPEVARRWTWSPRADAS